MKLLVIDYSVLCFNIMKDLENLDLLSKLPWIKEANPDYFKNKDLKSIADQFIKLKWIESFYRGPNYVPLESFTPVLVFDAKPYWRSKLYPDYKGGRPSRPDTFYSIKSMGERLGKKLNIPCLSVLSYEADDIAAGVVKIHELCKSLDTPTEAEQTLANAEIMLWTVDSDWHQLITDSVTWYNTGPWEPLVRTQTEAKQWAKRRLKVDINHPQDIVPIKCQQGDKSDNLPPGTPAHMIDLWNTHQEYRLLNSPQFVEDVIKLVEAPRNNVSMLNQVKRELSYFMS